ncbi:IS3 family transposase [Nitratireductor alexandrii]|uniref:IS3 family transposase n=1 Tax=Nitratireductor alexandrii TaxID=2448161 RepID=UPI003B845768
MRRIDEQFLETPIFGVRQMTWHLRNDGHSVDEKRIRRLMRLIGLMPIFQKPNTSRPAKGARPFPACSEACAWIARTRSGAWTSLICPCSAGSSTWW